MTTIAAKNTRTANFKKLFDKLPPNIQELSKGAFKTFCENPWHPALRCKQVTDKKNTPHHDGSFSVSITMRYRSLFYVEDDKNVWYWTGSHADYNTLIGSKKK